MNRQLCLRSQSIDIVPLDNKLRICNNERYTLQTRRRYR